MRSHDRGRRGRKNGGQGAKRLNPGPVSRTTPVPHASSKMRIQYHPNGCRWDTKILRRRKVPRFGQSSLRSRAASSHGGWTTGVCVW